MGNLFYLHKSVCVFVVFFFFSFSCFHFYLNSVLSKRKLSCIVVLVFLLCVAKFRIFFLFGGKKTKLLHGITRAIFRVTHWRLSDASSCLLFYCVFGAEVWAEKLGGCSPENQPSLLGLVPSLRGVITVSFRVSSQKEMPGAPSGIILTSVPVPTQFLAARSLKLRRITEEIWVT